MIRNHNHRRFGRFFLSWDTINDHKDVAELAFQGMVILSAENQFDRDGMEYVGMHDSFDVVPIGNVMPTYEAVVDFGTHHKELTWRKAGGPGPCINPVGTATLD